jgi:hypothetical protein
MLPNKKKEKKRKEKWRVPAIEKPTYSGDRDCWKVEHEEGLSSRPRDDELKYLI